MRTRLYIGLSLAALALGLLAVIGDDIWRGIR